MEDLVLYTTEENSFTDDKLSIFWVLTTKCNYDCFYCLAKPHKKIFPNPETIQGIINFIFELPNKNIDLFINGGEPTIVPGFLKIIKEISEKSNKTNKKIKITVLSNMSQNTAFYEEILSFNNLDPYLFFSFHRDHVSSDVFIPKYLDLKHKFPNNVLEIAYMMHNQDCINIFQKNFEKYPNLPYYLKPIKGQETLSEQLPLCSSDMYVIKICVFLKQGEYRWKELKLQNLKSKNLLCPSFSKLIYINENGFIGHCLEDNNLKLKYNDPDIYKQINKKKFIICKKETCFCHTETPKVALRHKHLTNLTNQEIKTRFKEL